MHVVDNAYVSDRALEEEEEEGMHEFQPANKTNHQLWRSFHMFMKLKQFMTHEGHLCMITSCSNVHHVIIYTR